MRKTLLAVALSLLLILANLMIGPDLAQAASGGSDNLALNKTATQSSVGYGGDPHRAVDGNTNSNYFDNSITHTNSEPQAWWQVDLGDQYAIDSIELFNRLDCCSGRLNNFYVMVSDAPLPTDLTSALDQSEWSQHFTGIAGAQESFMVGAQGRYVQVQLGGQDYLSLAEVVVMGDPTPTKICEQPYILNPDTNHCYGLTDAMFWPDAEAVAEAAGGTLVTINDSAEQDWLLSTFADQTAPGYLPSFWIGYTDVDSPGNYSWVSGETPDYTSWNTAWGEPNDYGDRNERYADICAQANPEQLCPEAGVWNDRPSPAFGWPQLRGIIELS